MKSFAIHLIAQAVEDVCISFTHSSSLQLTQLKLHRVLNTSKTVPYRHCPFTIGHDAMSLRILRTSKTTCINILNLILQCVSSPNFVDEADEYRL